MRRSTRRSTARETFVDTSGFYALLVRTDDQHERAGTILADARRGGVRFVTTDHVLDESATLLIARGYHPQVRALFDATLGGTACRIEWTDPARFTETAAFLAKRLDHDWSFTDCLSFVVMAALGLRDALTKDRHFTEAGFVPLLRS